jgi:hypothetical protein
VLPSGWLRPRHSLQPYAKSGLLPPHKDLGRSHIRPPTRPECLKGSRMSELSLPFLAISETSAKPSLISGARRGCPHICTSQATKLVGRQGWLAWDAACNCTFLVILIFAVGPSAPYTHLSRRLLKCLRLHLFFF